MLRIALLFLFLALASNAPGEARPNILYVYVDDMGWGAIGPNGQAERKAAGMPHLITPHLGRLAAEGVNFRRSYGCTVCSPARSSQQSGFHQGHTFADRNDPDNAKKAMRSDDLLMGDVLSSAGYVTGYWGKWGFGGSRSQTDPEIVNVQTLPTSHGYQHVVAELHHVRAHTFFQPTLWRAPAPPGVKGGMELVPNSMARWRGQSAYPEEPAWQNHSRYPDTAYCDDVYAFSALEFVRRQALDYLATAQPFFGLLAVQVPHAPFAEIAQLPGWDRDYRALPFWDSLSVQARHWAAMITRIDGHLGNILAALEDPNGDGDPADSVADDTLVIFQSDNGGPQHPAREAFAANGGLKGEKGKIQEGGIRVPTLMRLPANFAADSDLKPGTSTDQVIDVTDLLPTFAELAGVPAPLGIDGVSLAPALFGSGHQRLRQFLIHEAGNGQSIIRGEWKLIRAKSGLELYHLGKDPGETNDLASARPGLVEELELLLLGERVAEPKGFANTYHHWVGRDGAMASDASNWSDYIYANEGITYLKDDGAPQISWTALMENTRSSPVQARANSDLEFLGLEIRGNTHTQSLRLGRGINLTGRNEMRLSEKSVLVLDGGKVSSQRWVDIAPGGALIGSGIVQAKVYNAGVVAASGKTGPGKLQVQADYVQVDHSTLRVVLNENGNGRLVVEGEATLAGALEVDVGDHFRPTPGSRFTIVTAHAVTGAFHHAGNRIVAGDGTRFRILYSDAKVTLIAE